MAPAPRTEELAPKKAKRLPLLTFPWLSSSATLHQVVHCMRRRRCSALALALLPARHGDCLPLPGSRRRLFARVPAQYESLRRDPALFQPEAVDTWLDPRFQKMVEAVRGADATGEDAMDVALSHVTAEARDLYSFPLLTEDACERLLCEVEAFRRRGCPHAGRIR